MLLNVPCKAGKLQVDEGVIRVVAPFNKLVWQVPTGAVTKIVTQPSGIACIVMIHTTQGPYTVEMVTKANAEKLQALFPHLQNINAERSKHWYQDITKRTHVETYTNQKAMQKEVEQAAQHGWIPQTSAGIGGHVNAGKMVAGAILTAPIGGVGALWGTKRTKDQITMTFIRTPEWLAQH